MLQANITPPVGTQTGNFNTLVSFAVPVTGVSAATFTLRAVDGNGITDIAFDVVGVGVMASIFVDVPEEVSGSFEIALTGEVTREGGRGPEPVMATPRTITYDTKQSVAVMWGEPKVIGNFIEVPVRFEVPIQNLKKRFFRVSPAHPFQLYGTGADYVIVVERGELTELRINLNGTVQKVGEHYYRRVESVKQVSLD